MTPAPSDLQDAYLTGLFRNIHAILAGVYGVDLDIPTTNRSRGDASNEVLLEIITRHRFLEVRDTLLDKNSRTEFQGEASLHDLAIGFTMLWAAKKIAYGKVDRASALLVSGAILGQAISKLRELFHALRQHAPERLVAEWDDIEIEQAFPRELSALKKELQAAVAHPRAKQLKPLEIHFLNCRTCLGLFFLIYEAELDTISFDRFLAAQ